MAQRRKAEQKSDENACVGTCFACIPDCPRHPQRAAIDAARAAKQQPPVDKPAQSSRE